MYAEVIVDIAHSAVDRLFTYLVPSELRVEAGQRVIVPFGGGNRATEGFVLRIFDEYEDVGIQLKSIIRTLEPYPVLTAEQLELAKWIARTYRCVLADALRLMIPAQLRGARIKPKLVTTVTVRDGLDAGEVMEAMGENPRSPRQYEVLKLFRDGAVEMSASDIAELVQGAQGAIAALVKKGVLEKHSREAMRSPSMGRVRRSAAMELTPAQSNALERIMEATENGGAILLHGVTGSGKTEVYMQSVARVLEKGGGAIILVPEIALTPQTVHSFRSRFGDCIAVLHSRLSSGERYDEWRRIRGGSVRVVVGARSAVFAPVANLKLIVVDEEHEPSYRSEITPRYSAVEVALKRCRMAGGVLVLGSATPSIDSYFRAKKGRYELVELPERVMKLPMPTVHVVDMREEFMAGNTSIFSGLLLSRLSACLENRHQAILFMNRRGYSTFVSCRGCGYVFKCPDCDVSMTYHKPEGVMKCHYCGRVQRVPEKCPSCGKPYIKFFGVGTQQVEEQFLRAFPGRTCIRMDTDTTKGKDSHFHLLEEFASGGADVLIGTQMIAKGLDIKNVSLVGVIAADAMLHIPDFRSRERSFQLLTQVSGRAGRADIPGQVVVQAYCPDHPIITFARNHDYKGFYEYETAERRASLFPPYSLFVRVLLTGESPTALSREVKTLAETLRIEIQSAILEAGGDPRELLMLAPMQSPIGRKQGVYRYQVLIRLLRTAHTSALIDAVYKNYGASDACAFPSIEINPPDMF